MTTDNIIRMHDLEWPEGGIPDGWVTLFGRAFENDCIDLNKVSFDRFTGSDRIREFANNNGFDDRLDKHLHRTICIDIDLDCFMFEWHLSFPSEKERIAWMLSMDWTPHIEGWN